MANQKRVKKWIKRNHLIINILIALIGLAVFVYGSSVRTKNDTVGTFLLEVGIALITNALLLAISLLYFKDDEDFDEAKALYEEKGLINLYDNKKKMNEQINDNLLAKHNIKEYDILCCGGLTELRKTQGQKLIDYIKKKHMRIRILTANPHLEYLLQQKIDEDRELVSHKTYQTFPVENAIRNSIFDLYEWICEKRKELETDNLQDYLQIKFYNSLPSMQYHRVGNHVFVGQRLVGSNSQSTPSFEFIDSDNPNDPFSRYTNYFDMLWCDPNFSQDTPSVKLNPQLLINNKVVNDILKLSSADIASDLRVSVDRIRAVFTVCGFPKPLEDGEERRYNTNIVRGSENVNVQQSNGAEKNGKKVGYPAKDPTQVVGRCIASHTTTYEVTGEDSRYSILAIPFCNSEGRCDENTGAVAALSFEFDRTLNAALGITDNDHDIKEKEQAQAVIRKADHWAKLLAGYLQISVCNES